jgi:MFS family permease
VLADDTQRGYGPVFANRISLTVMLAQLASLIGTVAAQVALSIIVFQRTGSPFLSALVLAAAFIPQFVAGTFFSAVSDRFDSRTTLVVCDLMSAFVVLLMLIPGTPVALLLLWTSVLGLISPIFSGARSHLLATRTSADLFVLTRSLMRSSSQLIVLAGFGIGSVLFLIATPVLALAVNAVSFVMSALLVWFGVQGSEPSVPEGKDGRSLARQSFAGMREVWAARRPPPGHAPRTPGPCSRHGRPRLRLRRHPHVAHRSLESDRRPAVPAGPLHPPPADPLRGTHRLTLPAGLYPTVYLSS